MERGQDDTALQEQLMAAKTTVAQIELTVARLTGLRQTQAQIQGEMERCRGRLRHLASQRIELQLRHEADQIAVRQKRAARTTAEEAEVAKRLAAEEQLRLLETSVPLVLSYLQNGGPRRVETVRSALQELEQSLKRTSQEMESLSVRIETARTTLSDQHRRSAEMNRYIHVFQQQRSIDADEAHLAKIDATLSEQKASHIRGVETLLGPDARTKPLSELRDRIAGQISTLEKTRAQQEGNVEAMLLDVSQLKSQLHSEKYQAIEKRYRSTFLKVQSAESSIKDVEKYYSALEKAVQSYHQEKITQINRIIADLWRQTYRGSDIDTVEIHSETEGTSTTAARRSYSYRVVMKRGNSEIDMRGRCSAGQKVMASVIIRLALSEAFCCDCGIFALDEPTTNLDEDNARSLAEALRALIETRRAVKHFQLIVITHDEQFVRALGGQSLNKFYYVQKDREGAFSVISERTFDQLFA